MIARALLLGLLVIQVQADGRPDDGPASTREYVLYHVEAELLREVLVAMFTPPPEPGEPPPASIIQVELKEGCNSLLVTGTREWHDQVAEVLASVDRPPPPPPLRLTPDAPGMLADEGASCAVPH